LTKYALERLQEKKWLRVLGPTNASIRGGVISFIVDKVHSHDIAEVLNSEGIAIRSGRMCAEPLLKRLGVDNVARASFYLYNSIEDIDSLVRSLDKVREVFRLG